MKSVKLLLVGFVMAAMPVAMSAAEADGSIRHHIVIQMRNGETVRCAMDSEVTFSFAGSALEIECGESHPAYAFVDIAGFKYEEIENSAVDGIKDGTISFEFKGDILTATGTSSSNILYVHNMEGKIIESVFFSESVSMNVSSYPAGVYIATINGGHAIKILKK